MQGFYYLADAGYPNGSGVLTPYRGQRYHLNDWGEGQEAETKEEFFNQKHSEARNVIERCFGVLKQKWGILRSPAFFPIKIQNRILIACVLLHNHIRNEMPTEMDVQNQVNAAQNFIEPHGESYTHIDTSEEWGERRDNLATEMWMFENN